jgi:hypothetical protein
MQTTYLLRYGIVTIQWHESINQERVEYIASYLRIGQVHHVRRGVALPSDPWVLETLAGARSLRRVDLHHSLKQILRFVANMLEGGSVLNEKHVHLTLMRGKRCAYIYRYTLRVFV